MSAHRLITRARIALKRWHLRATIQDLRAWQREAARVSSPEEARWLERHVSQCRAQASMLHVEILILESDL